MPGTWHRVVPVPGALTINIGDMMQVLSNGRFIAPLHRVLANSLVERWSAPFFLNPSYDSPIRPLAVLGEPRYHALSWSEFRRRRFEGDFANYGSDVQISEWAVTDCCEKPWSENQLSLRIN